MKKKCMVVAFACLATLAIAQSSNTQPATASQETKPRDLATGQASGKTASQSGQVTAPRDLATGQASGKRQYQPVIIRKATDSDLAAQSNNASPNNGGQTSRESSAPSVSEIVVTKPSAKEAPRVAAGDVNGDGRADVSATASSSASGPNAAINNSHSNIKQPKDLATGQASGKRQHEPVTFQKEVGPSSPSR